MTNSPPIIAFDSNVLTFFVEAGNGHYAAPADDPLREEKIAAFRLFLFCRVVVLLTVSGEAPAIPDAARLTAHLTAIGGLLTEVPPNPDQIPGIARRATEFLKVHSGENDCLLLAQAEAAEIRILVTLDMKFRTCNR